jgi:Uma2 family endonuclease
VLIEQVAAGQAPSLVPLTVDQYHVMLEKGILRDGDPIELVEGFLVRKNRASVGENEMTHGARHASAVKRLVKIERALEPLDCHLLVQLPVTLSNLDEPEPDGAIVKGSVEEFRERHPGADDLLVVFEVSDSSLGYDRGAKRRVYAAAGVPIYVIVNVPDRQLEVYEQPSRPEGRYERRQDYRSGDRLDLLLAPGRVLTLVVDEMLGAPRP